MDCTWDEREWSALCIVSSSSVQSDCNAPLTSDICVIYSKQSIVVASYVALDQMKTRQSWRVLRFDFSQTAATKQQCFKNRTVSTGYWMLSGSRVQCDCTTVTNWFLRFLFLATTLLAMWWPPAGRLSTYNESNKQVVAKKIKQCHGRLSAVSKQNFEIAIFRLQ